MKTCLRYSLFAFIFGSSLGVVSAATLTFSVSSGDWAAPANWGGTLPGSADTAVITNTREAIVSSVISATPNTIRAGNNGNGGTLRVTGGSLVANNFQAATAADSTGHLIISGGTLSVNNSSFLSANGTVTGTSSTLSISGGTFNWGSALNLGKTGTTLATVTGSSAAMSGASIDAGAGTTFSFVLGATGVSAYSGAGTETSLLTLANGASLVVDFASYGGGAATLSLFNSFSGGISGGFGSNVSFLNPGSLSPQLVVGADSISVAVVPEPRSVALMAGLLGLIGALWTRRRHS